MASLVYNSALDDLAKGLIDFDTDNFYLMLVGSGYTPDKDAHTKRSDVSSESSGAGYVAGGQILADVTVTKDNANDRVDVEFDADPWTGATLTARGAVIYKFTGGGAAADPLVAYIDFGSDIVSTAGDFIVTFTSPLRFQN